MRRPHSRDRCLFHNRACGYNFKRLLRLSREAARPPVTCSRCCGPLPDNSHRRLYCSEKCLREATNERGLLRYYHNSTPSRRNRRRLPSEVYCIICGCLKHGHGQACGRCRALQLPGSSFVCPWCGAQVTPDRASGDTRTRWCSQKCSVRWYLASRRPSVLFEIELALLGTPLAREAGRLRRAHHSFQSSMRAEPGPTGALVEAVLGRGGKS